MSNYVLFAKFSPDGKTILTSSKDNTARLWDVKTGKMIVVLRGHDEAVTHAEFSPNGTRIVTGSSDGSARIWDAATGKLTAVLRNHECGDAQNGYHAIQDVTFAPDGTSVLTVAANDKCVRIWSAATGNAIAVLVGQQNGFNSAAFSPDGAKLVTAYSDKTVQIWNAMTGAQIFVFRGHTDSVGGAAFSPDGKRVLSFGGDCARFWEAADGREVATFGSHDNPVAGGTFSPDGTRVLTTSRYDSYNVTPRLWEAATGRQIAILRDHEEYVSDAAFSPDGKRVVTASSDKTARVWDLDTVDDTPFVFHDLAYSVNLPDQMPNAVFSPDGTRVVVAFGPHFSQIEGVFYSRIDESRGIRMA